MGKGKGANETLNRKLGRLVQVDGDDFGDTALFHGHAVQGVGEGHGFLVVGDDDELGFVGHLFQHFLKANDIGFVQWRVDFRPAGRTGWAGL